MIAMHIIRVAICLICFLSSTYSNVKASPAENDKRFEKTADGVTVFADAALSGNTCIVKLQVISDNIIRVPAASREPEVIHPLTSDHSSLTIDH
jgi:hypothetical protein